MATFSTNQVRQLYVVKSLGTVNANSPVGTLEVAKDVDGALYFKYMGAGGQTRSDLIDIASIMKKGETAATKMQRGLKRTKLVLDSNVNSGAPIAGQDYILRLAFRNHIGISDENQYIKHGAVRGVTGMTAVQFYDKMVDSLTKNLSREAEPLVNVELAGTKATVELLTDVTVTAAKTGADGNNIKFQIASVSATSPSIAITETSGVKTIAASLTAANKGLADLIALVESDPEASSLVVVSGTSEDALTTKAATALAGGTTTGIIIEEAIQPWSLGLMPVTYVNFTVHPTTVTDNNNEVVWGVVSDEAPTTIVNNGKVIADLEYFAMGERGDQYRNVGFPNSIQTTYLVDPTKAYNTYDIYYAWSGNSEDIQKSNKYITLVYESDVDISTAITTAINA